mmetsp:Transcript_21955/g.19506  ORF Transcript_21955/g.19506 Transcript_21955/m.19506 type:complete len:212 (+) Transcript_21955:1188-1823(+)
MIRKEIKENSKKYFHNKINNICNLRARRILREVYKNWAKYTRRHERYRKANQMAAIFYLKNLYSKVLIKGFKWNNDLKKKGYQLQYQRTLKTASECFNQWKNEYLSLNVIREIDIVREKKTKTKCFNAILEHINEQKKYREIHNTIVINHLMNLKKKTILALRINVRITQEEQLKNQLADQNFERNKFKKVFSHWLIFLKNAQEDRSYGTK